MAKFVFAYTGGSGMAETPEAAQAVMAQWGAWFGQLGAAVVDGGNPFGESTTVAANGSASGSGASGLGGYSIVTADSLADAVTLSKGCPVLATGGSVEVYTALDM